MSTHSIIAGELAPTPPLPLSPLTCVRAESWSSLITSCSNGLSNMSAVRFFSCFQRAAAPWTCRACERATVATATLKATGPFQRQQWRAFATEAAEAAVRAHPRRPKRRRWRWVAGGAVVVGGGAFVLSEDLQHAAKAAPRVYRVATTLFLCLYECVTSYTCSDQFSLLIIHAM